jgi:hypothetical protein
MDEKRLLRAIANMRQIIKDGEGFYEDGDHEIMVCAAEGYLAQLRELELYAKAVDDIAGLVAELTAEAADSYDDDICDTAEQLECILDNLYEALES